MDSAIALPEPAHRLAPQARWVWRFYWALGSAAVLAAGVAIGDELPGALATLAWVLPLVSLLVGTALVPELRWRRWRWEVREHEVDLRRGTLVVRRTLIPMARVQHVETSRGLLAQAFGLATVDIHTAAGNHEIPLLSDSDAWRLRGRIAELARTGDDAPVAIAEPAPADDG